MSYIGNWGNIICTLDQNESSPTYGTLVLTKSDDGFIAENSDKTPWYNNSEHRTIIKHVDVKDMVQFNEGTILDSLFHDCNNCESIVGLNNLDMSNVTSVNLMFSGCSTLKTLDVSNWNTSKITSIYGMFNNCNDLTTIEGLNNWDVTLITHMNWMFSECHSLQTLDLSKLITPNVQYIGYMFNNCDNLVYLNLSGLNLKTITFNTSLGNMLNGLTKLETIVTPYQFDYNDLFQTEFKTKLKDRNLKECDTGKLINETTIIKPSFIYTNNIRFITETQKICDNIANVLN